MLLRSAVLPKAFSQVFVGLFMATAIPFLSSSADAASARPRVANGTLVAENGSLLRGARWSQDLRVPIDTDPATCHSSRLPNLSSIQDLKSRGLNTLHVYGEKFEDGLPAGYNQCELDQLVAWTRTEGLYLILTIGNAPPNYNAAFVLAFWDHYGTRYRNEAHVVYEVQNEPYHNFGTGQSQPVPAALRTLQQDVHDLLRSCDLGDPCATSTPILFFSYPTFKDGPAVIQDIQSLNGVDWNKGAVAFHGYAQDLTDDTVVYVTSRGYPVIETESALIGGDALDIADLRFYEASRTSWMIFQEIPLNNTKYKTPIENGWVVWIADFGTWPASSNPPFNQTVSFKVGANDRWVSADLNVSVTNPPLVADRTWTLAYEKFDVVFASNTTVALKAQANGKYVQLDASGYLRATSSTPVVYEWMNRADGRIALRALTNFKFVSADFNLNNPPWLIANRLYGGGPWEGFILLEH